MDILKEIVLFVNNFFLIYIILYGSFMFLSVVSGSISFYFSSRRKKLKNTIERDYYIPISILVPAHNEAVTILNSIDSLLNLDYRLYEIIIIDDGSTDETLDKLKKHYDLVEVNKVIRAKLKTKNIKRYYESKKTNKILVIEKENGGKADSLNAGINAATNPYVVTIDADTILDKNSLTELAKLVMEDNEVIAAGGVIRLSNELEIKDGKIIRRRLPNNPLEVIQCLEYDRTFLAGRTVFDLYNGNLIISGAFGLFKKQLLLNINGYKTNTIGEDMELVLRLHDYCRSNKINYKIKYANEATCYTQAPSNLKDLKKQRKRWHKGLMQSLSAHMNMLFNPKFGLVGTLSFIYYLVYELLAPITETIGLVFIILAYCLEIINIKFMLMYLLIYVLLCTIFTITSFFNRAYTNINDITMKEYFKVIFYSLIENFGFRQLVNIYRLEAFFSRGKNKLNWGSIERKKMSK